MTGEGENSFTTEREVEIKFWIGAGVGKTINFKISCKDCFKFSFNKPCVQIYNQHKENRNTRGTYASDQEGPLSNHIPNHLF